MVLSLDADDRPGAAAGAGGGPCLRVGLVGQGIGPSRTPAMHEAEGRALGLDYRYRLLDPAAMPPPRPVLAELLDAAERAGYAGLNVTYPYKTAVMELLDDLSDAARLVGAVNTVVFRDGRRRGHNTDFWGFAESVRRGLPGAALDRVLLVGAGGAGAAIAHALRAPPEAVQSALLSGLADVGVLMEPTTVVAKAWEQIVRIGERSWFEPKRVLVTGAGPIGALCAAVARQRGAVEVVVTDLQDATLAVAARMGATQTVNVGSDGAAMEAFTADKGHFDVAFECSAAPAALRTAITTVRPRGTIVQVGVTGDIAIPLNLIVSKEIALKGTHRFHPEFAEAVRLIDSGAIDVKPIITGSYPLERALEAFEAAGDHSRSVKVHLTFA